MNIVADGPFDIRYQRYVIKPEKRTVPVVGPLIADVRCEQAAALETGLSHRDSDRLPEHDTAAAGMMLAERDKLADGLVFTLPAEQPIESIAVWNYNRPSYTDQGAATMDISVWTEAGGWKSLQQQVSLREGEGSDDYDDPTILTFKPVAASKIRFEKITSIDPKSRYVGLSAVRFYGPLGPAACNPEPADGSQAVFSTETQLAWTPGRGAVAHDVYMGISGETLNCLGRMKGADTVQVSGLAGGQSYAWRIDEVAEDGTVRTGPTWSFTLNAGKLVAHWPLNDSARDIVGGFDGTIAGKAVFEEGHDGQAMVFDGKTNRVELPALNLNSNSLTVTAWVKRKGRQDMATALFYTRSGRTPDAGLILTSNGCLWSRWGGPNWRSTFETPDGQWAFVAYVVEPSKTTLYLHDGQPHLESQNGLQGPEEFDGAVYLGWDQNYPKERYFKGLMDDVKVFDFPLSAAQLEQLSQGQSLVFEASGPIQLVGAELVEAGQSLKEVAKEQQGTAEPEKKTNLLPVVIIMGVLLVVAAASAVMKKKK